VQAIPLAGYPGEALGKYGSQGAAFSVIGDLGADAQAVVMRLEPNGLLGRHPAPVPQLMIVIHGEGYVRGEDPTPLAIRPGVAIRWNAGEQHETWTEATGLVLVIIEARDSKLGFQH
jgi:hypothetical protein